jgi:hypothetical protein
MGMMEGGGVGFQPQRGCARSIPAQRAGARVHGHCLTPMPEPHMPRARHRVAAQGRGEGASRVHLSCVVALACLRHAKPCRRTCVAKLGHALRVQGASTPGGRRR